MPSGRVGWVVLALALLLLLASMAYAFGPAAIRFFGYSPCRQYVGEAGLAQELLLSQTVDGVTVTVDHAYADASQILVGLNLSATSGLTPMVRIAWLGLADGVVFPWTFTEFPAVATADATGGASTISVNEPHQDEPSPPPPLERQAATDTNWFAAQAWLYSGQERQLVFDVPELQGAPAVLHLRLVMHLQLAEAVFPTGEEFLRADPPPTPMPGTQGYLVGPFDFEFGVPLLQGDVVEVHQTVEASGVPITLEKVTITPSETRAILRFSPPDAEVDWFPVVELELPGGELAVGGPRALGPSQMVVNLSKTGDREWVLRVPAFLGDRHGEWTLTVTKLVDYLFPELRQREPLVGPWVFTFELP
jgi:hypothetical protein